MTIIQDHASNKPVTTGQKKQIVRLIQDALPDTNWIEQIVGTISDKNGAQMLIESGNALHEVRKFLADKVKELSDSTRYVDQIVKCDYGYFSGYRHARPIVDQIVILRQYDWGREVDWELNEAQKRLIESPAPQGSEGYFAVVFNQTMVVHYEENPIVDQSGPVTSVLDMLLKQYGDLENFLEDRLDPEHYRRSKKSAEKMRCLWESQGCPTGIIIIPAQLGIRYRGASVLRARVEMDLRDEIPLDAYETLQMILTHDERLKNLSDLGVDFPGGEFSEQSIGIFTETVCAWWEEYTEVNEGDMDGLHFGYNTATHACENNGSASGFFPK